MCLRYPLGVSRRVIAALWLGPSILCLSGCSAVHRSTPIPPSISWKTPAPIVAGLPLSSDQLNAVSQVPGRFNYSPEAGAILSVGKNILSATFTPQDTVNYSTVVTTVVLTVLPPGIEVRGPSTSLLQGTTFQFSATVSGIPNPPLLWAVNGIYGGSPSFGTITETGMYSAPLNGNQTVTINVSLQSDQTVNGSTKIDIIAPTSSPQTIGFGFTLPEDAATSAGVYDLSGNLVRTLWSNQKLTAGPHVDSWDGNDDSGQPQMAATYQIRVLHNNVKYEWGLIGDSSSNWEGPNTWDSQSDLPMGMTIVGNTAYVADGYAEGMPNVSYFDLRHPNDASSLFKLSQCVEIQQLTTDGTLLYFANSGNAWAGSSSYVGAFDPASKQFYSFPSVQSVGAPGQACGPYTVGSVVDYSPVIYDDKSNLQSSVPTGIAVQPNGNLLAVSHGPASPTSPGVDQVRLFDKKSGRPLGDISIPSPKNIAFARDGSLWVISGNSVEHVISVGKSNTIATSLPELVDPLAIAVDPTTDDVLVADGDSSQQVKRFSSAGYLISTYGTLGGYSDCNPTVSDDRLYLDNSAGLGFAIRFNTVLLSVLPDSSFWIGDPGNSRLLHISAQGQYIERVSFLRWLYSIAVDHSDPSRVFAGLLEYSVDYDKSLVPGDPDQRLGGNGSWSLVRNWSACVGTKYGHFASVQTLDNGRTYGEITNSDYAGGALELVELTASGGLRFSAVLLRDSNFPELFDHSGNLAYWKVRNVVEGRQEQAAYQRTLIGFNKDGWPQWDAPNPIAHALPLDNPKTDPIGFAGWGMVSFPQPTSNGTILTYNTGLGTPGQDYHLGGIRGENPGWIWKASPGKIIDSPDDKGTFPDVEGYGGHNGIAVFVEGSNVFEGYDGQWGTFSNQWMHWSEDGLLIGQFGTVPLAKPDGTLALGGAGNIATMSTVTKGSDVYLYHSDESYHPGVHRYRISGLESVQEEVGAAPVGGTTVLVPQPCD